MLKQHTIQKARNISRNGRVVLKSSRIAKDPEDRGGSAERS
jgi:hypothetical protein